MCPVFGRLLRVEGPLMPLVPSDSPPPSPPTPVLGGPSPAGPAPMASPPEALNPPTHAPAAEGPSPQANAPEPLSLPLDPLAAVLSYLIPGLGQVYQGRIGKGLLFFAGLYGLFFYGMWMGQWRNVWIPEPADVQEVDLLGWRIQGTAKAIYNRPQFGGQVWIGTAAWPAIMQYVNFDKDRKAGPVFGTFERCPTEEELNALQRDGNKRWDLGWVYTVIAGVLNMLVIYDALAGPMFREPPANPEKKDNENGTW